jgi:predicted O-methyltransferase YrrM
VNLSDLHTQALDFTQIIFDKRLSHIMTEEQFGAYKTNVGHEYYLILYRLIELLKPKEVLELGTSIGRSSLFMMCALPPDSKLTTVEKGSYQRVDLKPFFDDPRLKIVYGDDTDKEVYEQFTPVHFKTIDFLFIDTEHNEEQLQKEWNIYKEFLVDGAIVVMDDIYLNEGMRKFWDKLLYEKIACPLSIHFSGFGILKCTTTRF